MDILGKKKMCGIMPYETGLPYRDVAVYGRYRKYGVTEELTIGAYELLHIAQGQTATLYEPDFTAEKPKYSAREILLRREGD